MEANTEKRKNEIEEKFDEVLNTPKKKKLLSTEKYIHQTLFLEGQKSDITLCILGETFNLHKAHLCQSPYFASMFSGSWIETKKRSIDIDIEDRCITIDSLKVALESLYNSEINIKPLEVVPILATASMFQLDGLIEQCTDVMIETINQRTVWNYYGAGCHYNIEKIENGCFEWFLTNLVMCRKYILGIKDISIPLMTKLINHPELVISSEISIYNLLKYWIGLQTNSAIGTEELPFLLTPDGQQYASCFEGLRLQNMMVKKDDLNEIFEDNIIPKNWIYPVISKQFSNILELKHQQQEIDPGAISLEIFLKRSLRYGLFIKVNQNPTIGCEMRLFSTNLLLMINGPTLSIRRREHLLSFQGLIHIILRVKVMKLNEQRQIVHSQQSDILKIPLRRDSNPVNIMVLESRMERPLLITIHILDVTSKIQETIVENR